MFARRFVCNDHYEVQYCSNSNKSHKQASAQADIYDPDYTPDSEKESGAKSQPDIHRNEFSVVEVHRIRFVSITVSWLC